MREDFNGCQEKTHEDLNQHWLLQTSLENYSKTQRVCNFDWTIDVDADVMSFVDKLIKHIDLTPGTKRPGTKRPGEGRLSGRLVSASTPHGRDTHVEALPNEAEA